jgi:hypothetical protein
MQPEMEEVASDPLGGILGRGVNTPSADLLGLLLGPLLALNGHCWWAAAGPLLRGKQTSLIRALMSANDP